MSFEAGLVLLVKVSGSAFAAFAPPGELESATILESFGDVPDDSAEGLSGG